jgi:hypothetical protein
VDGDLVGEKSDPSCDRAHGVAGATLCDRPLGCVAEPGAALHQSLGAEMTQLMSKTVRGGQHEGLEFVPRYGARANDTSTGHGVHTQRFSMPVVSAWDGEPVAAKCLAGGANCVEFVGLGAVLAGFLAGTIELDHPLTSTRQCSCETTAVARGALDGPRSLTRVGVCFGPADCFVVAGRISPESFGRDHAAGVGVDDRGGDPVAVGIDADVVIDKFCKHESWCLLVGTEWSVPARRELLRQGCDESHQTRWTGF